MIPRALVVAAFSATIAAQGGPDWAQLAPTASPGARRAGAMAFDAVSNKLISFGGISAVAPGGILAETWSFGPVAAVNNWALLSVNGAPPARWGHRMVRNTANNRLITFGGRSPLLGSLANDTWEFTGSLTGGTWAPVATGPGPSVRYLYGLAFDEVRNVAILFGGSNNITTFGDTWEYNGSTWTLRAGPGPSPREDMVLAYDRTMNRTVLFGGFDPATGLALGDTWLYDGTGWTLSIEPPQLPAITIPSRRYSSSAIYDSVRKRVVMFGGFDGAYLNDTYEFSGSAWLPIAATGALPPNATEAYAGYDPVRRRFLVFGGFGGAFNNQTWELSVPTGTTNGQPGIFGRFTAEGCAVNGEPPVIAATAPTMGQTMTITCTADPTQPAPLFGIVIVGLSNEFTSGIPLPLDLGFFGFGSCPLRVAADFLATPPIVGTEISLGINFPTAVSTPQLVNGPFYAQGVFIDTNLLLQTTPGARGVIGTPP